jgi:UDP-N-acetylglucosamine 2-epimerase (non-hydrolysing)
MKILHVVGARPNFMKAAPVVRSINTAGVSQVIVHTGQHYDFNMSDVFFQELGIPAPDINLQVGSGSHAQQTADIMCRFEPVLVQQRPDVVMVYGDVNSTAATALVCAKALVPVAHVEAGLRSGDRTMPEEINRLVTDQLSDVLFTHSGDATSNLMREGIANSKIHFVGNVMVDTLVSMLPKAKTRTPRDLPDRFILVTLHRPSNVDDLPWLMEVLRQLAEIGSEVPVFFPIHPRTRQRLSEAILLGEITKQLRILDPLPYLDFLALQLRAMAVITDSGGIQEETTYLGIPCLTVRENTERPITVEIGTNILVGRSTDRLREEVGKIIAGQGKRGVVPPLWDGRAAERIAALITQERVVSSSV